MKAPSSVAVLACTVVTACGGEPTTGPAYRELECPTAQEATAELPAAIEPARSPVVGRIEGSFAVTADGAASYSIPLEVPPGRNGMSPELSVSYDSSQGEGTLGMGFSLGGITAIERCPLTYGRDGTVRAVGFDHHDAFCLAGMRLAWVGLIDGDDIEYRTFPDTHVRVVARMGPTSTPDSGPAYWEVYETDHTIRRYGSRADARVVVSNHIVSSWWLSEHVDRHDNAIHYYYSNDPDEGGAGYTFRFYPLRIEYTAHPDYIPTRIVDFIYTSHTPNAAAYVDGNLIVRDRRLDQVRTRLVGADAGPVKRYSFIYDESATTNRVLLESIWECDPEDKCKPPTRFEWFRGGAAFEPPFAVVPPTSWMAQHVVADVNGDGLDDLVFEEGAIDHVVKVALNEGGSFAPPAIWEDSNLNSVVAVIDYDQDGRADPLEYDTIDSGVGGYAAGFVVHRATNASTFEPVVAPVPGGDMTSEAFAVFCPSGGISGSSTEHRVERVEAADFNADGIADLAVCRVTEACTSSVFCTWVSDTTTEDPFDGHWEMHDGGTSCQTVSDGWTLAWGKVDGFQPAEEFVTGSCGDDVKFVDLERDGKVDVLMPPADYFEDFEICLGGGDCNYEVKTFNPWQPPHTGGVTAVGNWETRDAGLPVHDPDGSSMFLDMNGDGLTDVLQISGATMVSYLNTGRGFDGPHPAGPIVAGPNWYRSLDRAMPIDMNADGNTDVVVALPCGAQSCWWLLQATPGGAGQFDQTPLPFPNDDSDEVLITDVDGDGRHDLIRAQPSVVVAFRNQGRTDLLNTITTGTNHADPTDGFFRPDVEIEYGSLIDLKRRDGFISLSQEENDALYVANWQSENTCEYPRSCVASPTTVVSTYWINNGNTLTIPTPFRMHYRDARYDKLFGGWLGFGARYTVDLLTESTDLERQDNQTFNASVGAYPFVGQTRSRWTWAPPLPGQADQTRLPLGVAETSFDLVETAGGESFFPYATRSDVWKQELDWDPAQPSYRLVLLQIHQPWMILSRVVTTIDEIDPHGNILLESSRTDDLETRTTTRIVDDDEDAWLLGLVLAETICSAVDGETQCRKRSPLYTAEGDVQREITDQVGDASTTLKTEYQYDATGNRTLTTRTDQVDLSVRQSCTTWDTDKVFPIANANAYGHTTFTRFDPKFGVRVGERDADGRDTRWQLDGFGRTVIELRADGTTTTTTRSREKTGGPSASWWITKLRVAVDGASDIVEVFDMADRIVRRDTQPPTAVQTCELSQCPASPLIREDYDYDLYGQLASESRPYLASVPASKVVSTYEYDGLGRRIVATTPWGETTSTSYQLNEIRRTDSAGTELTVIDGLERPIKVIDRKGTHTRIEYGPFGAQREVDTAGDVTTWVTDAFGRVRTFDDPNRGVTTSTYNGYGEPRFVTDALGRVVETRYDLLGRKTTRIDDDGTTTWTYDPVDCTGCPDTSESPDGVSRRHVYDALGRPSEVHLVTGSLDLMKKIEYDGQSRPLRLHYPAGGPVIQLSTDVRGFVWKVADVATGTAYWTATRADASGRVLRATQGNGLTTEREYDLERGTATAFKTRDGIVAIQDVGYDYDSRLNPTKRQDFVGGQVEYFQYDELDRLWCQSWTNEGHPACALELQYQPNGNIEKKSDVGLYTYSSEHPHAVETAGGAVFGYDAVGNQIKRPGVVEMRYKVFDLPSEYELTSGERIDFIYDAEQHRVGKTTSEPNHGDKVYLDDLYEQVTVGGAVTHRFYVSTGEGDIVITRDGGPVDEVSYLQVDAIGSAELVTDAAGNVVQERSHGPFGERRDLDWDNPTATTFDFLVTEDGFTGHEHDTEVGLVNMNGRIYDPVVGRFLQTDPVNTDPLFSQRWNSYSYVMNNPLRYTDPTGRDGTTTTSAAASTAALPPMIAAVAAVAAVAVLSTDPHDAGPHPIETQLIAALGDKAAPPPTTSSVYVVDTPEARAAYYGHNKGKPDPSLVHDDVGPRAEPSYAPQDHDVVSRGGFTDVDTIDEQYRRLVTRTPLPVGTKTGRVTYEPGPMILMRTGDTFTRYSAVAAGSLTSSAPPPAQLTAGQHTEAQVLKTLGLSKNTSLFRPTAEAMGGELYGSVVGGPRRTSGGLPEGTIVDGRAPGSLVEIKDGTSPFRATRQIRMQVFQALVEGKDLTVYTDRSPTRSARIFLDTWNVQVRPLPRPLAPTLPVRR